MSFQKNVAGQKWLVFAYNRTTNAPVTGDAANISAKIRKDYGVATATNDAAPTEIEDGYYEFDLTQIETNADVLDLLPESITADVQVIAYPVRSFTKAPNSNALAIDGSGQVTVGAFASGAITSSAFGANAIAAAAIADGAIDAATFAAGAINAAAIADGAIDAATFAAGAINAAAIADASIDLATFAAGVLPANFEDMVISGVDGAVNSNLTKIAGTAASPTTFPTNFDLLSIDGTGQVAAGSIAAGAIGSAAFAAGAIDAAAIANGAIDAATFAAGAIDAAAIANGAIDAATFAAGAINAAAIADGAVTAAKIGSDAITAAKIAAGAIDAATFAAGVLPDNFEAMLVDVSGRITVGTIASGAITAAAIATDAITNAKIAAGAITAAEASVNISQVSGDSAAAALLASLLLATTGGQAQTGTLTTTVITTNLTETNNFYNDMYIVFTSGANQGQARKISGYAQTNGQITVATAFANAPSNGDTFVITGRSE